MEEAQGICSDFRGKLEGPFLFRGHFSHIQNPPGTRRFSLETQNQYLHILIQNLILEQCLSFLSIFHVIICLFPQTRVTFANLFQNEPIVRKGDKDIF